MVRRIAVPLTILCFTLHSAAQLQTKTVVLTWGNDTQVQLFENPDGSFPANPPPSELLSGGLTGTLDNTEPAFGAPANNYLVTNFRLQSNSFSVSLNSQACGGTLITGSSDVGVGTFLEIAEKLPTGPELFTSIESNSVPACNGEDTAIVVYKGVQYLGAILFEAKPFTGTLTAPSQLANATGKIVFGKGEAQIQGTLTVEFAIGPTTNLGISPPPVGVGSPANNNTNAFSQEPINTGNGNYYYGHADFAIPGRGLPLLFQRNYNAIDNYAGPLGANWSHEYNVILSESLAGTVSIRWGDGHGETYTLTNGMYVPQVGVYN